MSVTNVDLKVGLSNTDKTNMANQITAETLNKLIPTFSTSVAYTKGQYTIYSNALYRFTANKSAGEWDSTKVDSTTLDDLIDDVNESVASVDDKANVDGYYASMSVGLSDNFNTNMTIEDKSPYNFRTSGGALEIANQCKEKAIVGGSVVYNQQARNGNFVNTDYWAGFNGTITTSNNKLTLTATSTESSVMIQQSGVKITNGHKYLVYYGFTPSRNGGTFVYYGASSTAVSTTENVKNNIGIIFTASVNSNYIYAYMNNSGNQIGDTAIFENFMLFDLTAMFGSTIADYIYTLETGQVSAGVAWFRKYFPKSYYAYNPGSFLNVKTSGKKITHFNQWNEQWESGIYSFNNGSKSANENYIRNKTPIRVLPNTEYYFTKPNSTDGMVLYYDANNNYLGYLSRGNSSTFTTPNNCYYICFYNYGTTYNNDICINLHWDGERDGEYEPYSSTTYPIENVELRGIPKLDSNNELYFDGDVYNADGSVEGRYTLIKAKNLGWNYYNNVFYVNVSDIAKKNMNENSNILSNSYTTMNAGYSSSGANKAIWKEQGSSSNTIYIRDDTYTDATTFINHFTDDDYILYEKATPTTTTATPFTELEAVDNWGTEEFLDTRDVPMPVGHITEYLPDLKAKLETAPESPEDDGYYIMKRDNGENSYSLLSTYLSANGYVVPTSISGYDATKTQVLKNVEGVLTWVDEEV